MPGQEAAGVHEYSIACEIFEQVIATSRAHGASEVKAVTLQMGRLTHTNPEQLKFCFDVLAEDSIAKRAEFLVEMIPPTVECECGYRGTVDTPGKPAGKSEEDRSEGGGKSGSENGDENKADAENETGLQQSELLEYVAALNCPACGRAARITGGQELIIKTIDIETEAEKEAENEPENKS